MTNHLGIEHYQYDDVNTPSELIKYMDDVLGEGTYSKKSLQIAATVKEYFGSYAIMNGDIVGQIGKCSLHRNIPESLATAGYFRCKMHNYSKEAKCLTKIWLKDIKGSDEHMSVFDLFSLENRMGRWSSLNTQKADASTIGDANSEKSDDYQDYAAFMSVSVFFKYIDELLAND